MLLYLFKQTILKKQSLKRTKLNDFFNLKVFLFPFYFRFLLE
jgi:hypothetical protein